MRAIPAPYVLCPKTQMKIIVANQAEGLNMTLAKYTCSCVSSKKQMCVVDSRLFLAQIATLVHVPTSWGGVGSVVSRGSESGAEGCLPGA